MRYLKALVPRVNPTRPEKTIQFYCQHQCHGPWSRALVTEMLNNLILDRPEPRTDDAVSLKTMALALVPATATAERSSAAVPRSSTTFPLVRRELEKNLPDFIAAADDVKSLLQMPYSARSCSQVVHRVGSTLILGGVVDASNSRQLEAELARRSPSPIQIQTRITSAGIALIGGGGSSRAVSYAAVAAGTSASGADVRGRKDIGAAASTAAAATAARAARSAHAATADSQSLNGDFLRVVRWTPPGTELQMVLGSNLITMAKGGGSGQHEVAVRLQDVDAPPLSSTQGLDYYLDNVMAAVPELALCFHDDGTYRGSKTIKTEDIPTLAPPGRMLFSPELVYSNGATILRFLKANTADLQSYWLQRDDGDDTIRLFDLSSLAAEDGVPVALRAGASKWRYMMAMMCLRYARHTKRAISENADAAESRRRQRDLLHKALALLTELAATGEKKYASIRASAHEQIAETFLAAAEDDSGIIPGNANVGGGGGGAGGNATTTTTTNADCGGTSTETISGAAEVAGVFSAEAATAAATAAVAPALSPSSLQLTYRMEQLQRVVKHLGQAIRTLRELADDEATSSMIVSMQVAGLQSKLALSYARLVDMYTADGQIARGLETMEKLLILQADVVEMCGAARASQQQGEGTRRKSIKGATTMSTTMSTTAEQAQSPAAISTASSTRAARAAIEPPNESGLPPRDEGTSVEERASLSAMHRVRLEVLRLQTDVQMRLRAWCTSEARDGDSVGAELDPLPELVPAYTLLESCGDVLLRAALHLRGGQGGVARARDESVDAFSLSDVPVLSRFLRELAPAVVVAVEEEAADESTSPSQRNLLDVIDGSVKQDRGGEPLQGPLVESVEQFLLLSALCFRAARAIPPPTSASATGRDESAGGSGGVTATATATAREPPSSSSSSSSIFISSSAGRKLGSVHNELARFYLEKGRLVDATSAFKTALEAFGAIRDRVNVALVYVNLAHTMKTMATAEAEARRATIDALELAVRRAAAADASSDCDESAGDPAETASNVMSSSLTATQRAHYERAIEFCDLAEAALRSGGSSEKRMRHDAELVRVWHKVRSQLAMVHLIYGVRLGCWLYEVRGTQIEGAKGDWMEGTERRVLSSLDAALRVYTEARDAKQVAAVHFQIGRVHRQLFELECTRRARCALKEVSAPAAAARALPDAPESAGLPTRRLRALFTLAGRHYRKAAALFREQLQVRTVVIVQLDAALLHRAAAAACARESRDRRRERQQLELALNALTSLAGAFAADGDSGSARGIAIAMGAGAEEEEEARSAAVTLPPTEEQRRSVLAHVSAVLQALLRLCRMGGDAKATAHYKAAYTAVLRGQGVKSLGALLEELLPTSR